MTSKRRFLTSSLAAGLLSAGAGAAGAASRMAGPGLLTLTGAVQPNRGPLNPALDQMMAKQQIAFARAHVFDFSALLELSGVTIRPTLEYDGKPHALRGPLLVDVLRAAGAPAAAATPLVLRAFDGYQVPITLGQVQTLRMVVATHLDGAPMPLGGLGPLWAVVDADRIAALAAKPLNERFAQCPWGLYHIAVGTEVA